jgi:DNA ligase (NAD+)
MLSLENSYNAEDLIDFDRKAKEGASLDEITIVWNPNLMVPVFHYFMKMIY